MSTCQNATTLGGQRRACLHLSASQTNRAASGNWCWFGPRSCADELCGNTTLVKLNLRNTGVDDDVVAPVQYLSADSSAEEGRGNGPKPTPPPVVSAEMQRTQAMEEKMTRRSRR